MKNLLIAAAALLVAAPAQAYPQWLSMGPGGKTYINYNSARIDAKGIRSVDMVAGKITGVMHVSCDKWRSALTVGGYTTAWDIIVPGSAGETAAYILCPGPLQQQAIKTVQDAQRGEAPVETDLSVQY